MTPTLKHVHDRFFKEAFSRLDVVTDFLEAYLPASFLSLLDLSSLTRLQDSHVDETLSQHYVDLLFEARFGQEPITIALLLSQFLPAFNYYLIDLTTSESDRFDSLRSNYARLTAGLLRTIRRKERLAAVLAELSGVIAQLAEDASGQQFIRTALVYIGKGSALTTVEIIAIFRNISQKTDQVLMSAYETWVDQGIREGIEKGMQQGMQQGVQKGMEEATRQHIKGLLRLNMDAQSIATAFELPLITVEEYIKQIRQEK